MATQIKAILEGTLPWQSAVFVIADKSQKRIHVLPVSVNSRYAIAESQYLSSDDLSVEAAGYLKDKCDELNVIECDDKNGFYMGRNAVDLGLFALFCDSKTKMKKYIDTDSILPYTRYIIPLAKVQNILGGQPDVKTRNYGPIKYQLCESGGFDKLAVSVNDLATDYVLFKIDQTAMMGEEQLSDGYIFLEQLLSAQWTQEQHSLIAEKATNLIGQLIFTQHDHNYDAVPVPIMNTIMKSMFGGTPWPVTIHEKCTFD